MKYSDKIFIELQKLYKDDFTESTNNYKVIKSIDDLKENYFVFFPFKPLFGVTKVILRPSGNKALYANCCCKVINEIDSPLVELTNFSDEDFQKTFEDHELGSIDEFYIRDIYSWYHSIEEDVDLSDYNLKGFPSMNEIVSVIRNSKQEEIDLVNLLSDKIELSQKLENKSILNEIILEKSKYPNLEEIIKDYPSISLINKDLKYYWIIKIST